MLGSSQSTDMNLSRAQAEPDFSKLELSYARAQHVSNHITLITRFSAQLSPYQLFSSEEFGYGGQTFGRAYDASEITGDNGVAAALELRYNGLNSWQDIQFVPYVFYDIGKVWNEDTSGVNEAAASSGTGFLVQHSSGLQGNLGIAFPLTRPVTNPMYGHGKSPRLLLQIGYAF